MAHTPTTVRTSPDRGPWLVLAALLVAVVVPTACVLWFMTTAMQNERWAVRQRLTQRYRGDLQRAKDALGKYWSGRFAPLVGGADSDAPQTFARLVRSGAADAVVIRDASGKVAYPIVVVPNSGGATTMPAWSQAEQIELDGDPARAAEAYAKIADQSKDPAVKALALQARARLLVAAGQTPEALAILTGEMLRPALSETRDAEGRLVVPNAMLLALHLIGDPDKPEFRKLADDLARRLNDYRGAAMLSTQRRFLMGALNDIAPAVGEFPTRGAEDLAARYLAERKPPAEAARLTHAGVEGLWHVAGPDGTVVAAFRQTSLIADSTSAAGLDDTPGEISIRLIPSDPSDQADGDREAFLTTTAPSQLPGWELQLHLVGHNPFTAAADKQRAAYLWTGTLGIVVIVVFAAAVARHLARQTKLTRLKNDLIATVSHELKTPLASMRAMVETLSAGRCKDRDKELEYFALLAKENERLSRMIDNFLTFSRMERNKRAFECDQLRPEQLVAEAVHLMAERFEGPDCDLAVHVEGNLPAIVGDRDALITVLLNLLSNACKYSGAIKHVTIRARADAAEVCLEVTDNGVGLSRREARKVFDRFYQVDQHVSRSVGGCGLGLSIVKFIVDAHGGTVDVASRPGKGSTFTVRLPAHHTQDQP